MTIFNTVQLPAFDGAVKATQPAAPQLSMPDDEAIQVFQQAYERPTEPPQAKERPVELPTATPETLAKVVEENLTLAKELPQPMEVLVSGTAVSSKPPYQAHPDAPVADNSVRAAPVADNSGRAASMTPPERPDVATPVSVERSAELPPATVETLAKVVEENLTLAKELPQPVELPVQSTEVPVRTTEAPVQPTASAASVAAPVAETPVARERPAELPAATPETLAKAVEENLTLAKELPQPVELPVRPTEVPVRQVEAPVQPTVSARPAAPVAAPVAETPVADGRPAELPPATPATLAKVVEENLTLAKELPKPLELPRVIENGVRPKDGAQQVGEAASRRVAGESVSRKTSEGADDVPVPQALPETVAGAAPAVTPTSRAPEAAPVAGVAAKVSAEVPRTAASVLVEAASAVADTLFVTPSLMRGDGEIRVQLKPDVLDGAQICIKVIGKSMQVEFASVTDDIARLMAEAQPQLIQRLAEKIPTFEVAVTVLSGKVTGRRLVRAGVGRSGEET